MAKRMLIVQQKRTGTVRDRKRSAQDLMERYFVEDDKDFVTAVGKVTKEQLQKVGSVERTDKGNVHVLNETFHDAFSNISRGAQIMLPKDLGFISATVGVTKEFRVLDVGSGSGASAIYFAHTCKEVLSCDVNEKHLAQAKKNAAKFNCDNLTLKELDVYSEVPGKDFDLFVLDVPEPSRALKTAAASLKPGGYLVVYTPQIHQAQKVILEMGDSWLNEGTHEIMDRSWLVSEKQLRPQTKDMLHTAFLTFLRKVA